MRIGPRICVATAISIFGVSAFADQAPPDLGPLLTIGTSKPQTDLRWGMARAQVRALFPALAPTTFSRGLDSVEGATTYLGCAFSLRLDSAINPKPHGALKTAILQYVKGPLQNCRHSLESRLTALYGDAKITHHPAGWPDGSGPPATVLMDWHSASTCVGLWWEDGEAQWAPSLRLTLSAIGDGCGGYDDQVVRPAG